MCLYATVPYIVPLEFKGSNYKIDNNKYVDLLLLSDSPYRARGGGGDGQWSLSFNHSNTLVFALSHWSAIIQDCGQYIIESINCEPDSQINWLVGVHDNYAAYT